MTALLILVAFLALLATTVAGITLATRNPRLEARCKQLAAECGQLGELASSLREWASEAPDDPQRAVVLDMVTRAHGTGDRTAGGHSRQLPGGTN